MNDPDTTIELRWHLDRACWHGAAQLPSSVPNPSVARTGPAGVVMLEEGDLRFSLCFITGRVEQVWIPGDRDDAQNGLLRVMCKGTNADLAPPPDLAAGVPSRLVTVRPAGSAVRIEAFRWAHLMNDAEHLTAPSASLTRVYLELEIAATAVSLYFSAPEWITSDRVGFHLASARAALLHASGRDDGSLMLPEAGSEPTAALRLGDLGRRWRDRFRQYASKATDDRSAEDASALAQALGPNQGGDREASTGGVVAGPVRFSAASASRPPVAAHIESSARLLIDAADAGGAERFGSDIQLDGSFEVTPPMAQRVNAAAGIGSLRPIDPEGWCQVIVPAPSDARLTLSRWAVAYDARGRTVGSTPLRCSAGSPESDSRVIGGRMAIAGPAVRIDLMQHPALPTEPVGHGPSVDRACAAARRAIERDAVGGDGSSAWAESALDWLQLGLLFRAAWAWRNGDPRRFAAGFKGDRQRLERAEAVLAATIAAQAVPDEEWIEGASVAPAWWWVEQASDSTSDDRADGV